MHKKLLSGLIIAILLVTTGCLSAEQEEPKNETIEEKVEENILPEVSIQILEENANETSSLSKLGTVKAQEKTTVIAEIAGRIEDLPIELGQKVKQGDNLATLGNSLNTQLLALNQTLAQRDKQIAQGILQATMVSNVQEIASMQKNIENSYINFENAVQLKQNTELNLNNQIESANLAIAKANEAYSSSLASLKTNVNSATTNFDNAYALLLKQARSAISNSKLHFDTADLVFFRINSKNNQIGGTIKRYNDHSTYKQAQHKFEKAIETLKSAEKKVAAAEKNNDPYAITYAGEKTLKVLDDIESVLVTGDSFVKSLRPDTTLGLDGQINEFNTTYPQSLSKLGGDRLALQQSLNAIKSTDAGNQVQLANLQGQKNQAAIQVQDAHNRLKQLNVQLKTELDKLNFQVETARNQYESSQAQLSAFIAKTKIQELQAANSVNQSDKQALTTAAQLDARLVKAPINGTVTAINVKKGDYTPQGQNMITIESTEDLIIETNITEIDAAKVQVGTEVSIKNSRGKMSKGKVKSIADAAGSTNKLVPIEISITKNNELKPNTFVRVQFDAEENIDGFSIPLTAIFFSKTSKTVYVVNNAGEIEEKEVKLKRILGSKVEIAEGLESGDKVITNGGRQLKAGDKVEVISS